MKQRHFHRLFLLMSAMGALGFSNYAMASAYQLWEQDGASVGNYHAGRAASAEDASTAFYNPAGLVRIHNQQVVVGLDPILTNFKFRGTNEVISPDPVNTLGPMSATAQGGGFNLVPDLHYAAPINDRFVFGFSIVAPFGLKTDYGTESVTRYTATLTSLQVIDVSPSIGFALTDKLSFGVGLDAEHARGEFDLIAGNPAFGQFYDDPSVNNDTQSKNVATSYAYGYHVGTLYQMTEQTRVGLAYNSRIIHHLSGDSNFSGPLANDGEGGLQQSTQLKTSLLMPAVTTLSVFHTFNPAWDVMGTVAYTQWSDLKHLVLSNDAGVLNGRGDNSITVIVPQNYRNTWNLSVGANYHVNEDWMLRAGVGFDQTPANDRDRNLELPDSNRIAVALGTHFQATKTLGFDMGWTHFFTRVADINNDVQVVGDQTTVTNGRVQGSADVFGLQVKWDIV